METGNQWREWLETVYQPPCKIIWKGLDTLTLQNDSRNLHVEPALEGNATK